MNDTPLIKLIDRISIAMLYGIIFLLGLSIGSNYVIKKATIEIKELREKIECLENERIVIYKSDVKDEHRFYPFIEPKRR